MKKVLSLMLAVALILTTMAVPMVVSAAEGDVTLTAVAYDSEGAEVNAENPAYMGDTVTIKILAQAETVAAAYDYLNVYFNLSSGLSYTSLPEGVTANANNANRLGYVATVAGTIAAAEATELCAIEVTVGAVADQTVTFEENYSDIVKDWASVTTAYTAGAVDVEAASAVAQVKTSVAADYTTLVDTKTEVFTDSASVSAKVVATGNVEYANLYKAGSEDVVADLTDGEATIVAADAGTYTIKVKMVGGEEAVYTFIYTAVEIDARVSIVVPEDVANGYTREAEFELPVTISGIGTFTAAMAQFEVTYDPSVLTLDTTVENINYDEKSATEDAVTYTVTVGENNDANIANEGVVTNLGFTVADDAAFGNTTVTINGVKWTQQSGSLIIVEDDELGVATASAALVIIPTGDFATVTPGATEATAEEYDVAVAAEEGVTVKVLALPAAEAFGDETDEADIIAEVVARGVAVTDGKYTVDKEDYVYYVAASVGTTPIVYDYIGVHESLLDVTGPEIVDDVLATLNQDAWTATVDNEEVAAIALPAELAPAADFAKFQWSTSATEGFVDATGNEIAIAADFSAETIYIKAVDALGNEGAAKSFTVKYDGTAPTFDAEVGLFNVEGTGKAINITNVADTYSGVATVKVYLDDAEKATLEAPAYAYTATDSGTYYVVVTDIAGNETKSEALVVDLGKVNLPSITVAIVNGGAAVADRFKNDAEIANYTAADNGTFSYVNIEVGAVEGAKVTYTLAKDGAEAEDKTGAIEIVGSEETAGQYVLTVTSTATADANNNNTTSYTFSIAGSAEEMLSVDNKPYYNALDYALVNKITTGVEEGVVALPTAADNFTGGIFSADVNGDLKYTAADVTKILSALQRVLMVGEYDFEIMNQFAPVVQGE